ncbi:hypothetical protein V1477_002553 [Vespula maculifrons]|uniref:Uncharacterized protein n=1 Tax=Vespula maculifrons TaxID=7453 RepID=A0ABD2CZM8_VESMC
MEKGERRDGTNSCLVSKLP